MTTTSSSLKAWKMFLIGLSLIISGAVFYLCQQKRSSPEERVYQFIATCTATLGVSSTRCNEMLEQWGDFFKR